MEEKMAKKKFSLESSYEKTPKICQWLIDHKAKDITAIDLQGHSNCIDVCIIATAGSQRQARALADGCLEFAKENNYEFMHLEGHAEASWVLVDLNDVVIHIFQEETRALYDLEGLWRDGKKLI